MSQAYFATRNNTKVTAQKGGTALLPCTVLTQTSALVSWVRRRDFQLLTVGLSTYSSDERFLVHHIRHMGHWALRIKAVRDEDQGLYECQLSVHPVQSVFVELQVVDAVADIVGAPDLHIDEGSTLRLECKLQRATEYPDYVFWYHQHSMVNFDQQNGFSVTPFQPVVDSEKPAAMQHANRSQLEDSKAKGSSSSSSSSPARTLCNPRHPLSVLPVTTMLLLLLAQIRCLSSLLGQNHGHHHHLASSIDFELAGKCRVVQSFPGQCRPCGTKKVSWPGRMDADTTGWWNVQG
ncbi:hypothetical protein RP20_CCG003956 [Aedes albopictus]|nr:hypothetical protein RP20_CCG003956 [Aedes albopictus]